VKRTIISLDPKVKEWLDKRAKETNQTMTQVVREAIQEYRVKEEKAKPSLKELLDKTRGTWKHGDGLKYQIKIRSEWR
jgi:predicted transcriptional regulator